MDDSKINRLKNKVKSTKDNELQLLINELIDERNELIKLVNIDPLTGAKNRRILEHIENFSIVVMCDLDDFKMINDTYEHKAGDQALKMVSNTISKRIRSDDVLCRYGGDEFVVVFIYCNLDTVVKRMREILDEIQCISKDNGLSISMSIGIAKRSGAETLSETISKADIAMYHSKSKKDGSIIVYNESKEELKRIL